MELLSKQEHVLPQQGQEKHTWWAKSEVLTWQTISTPLQITTSDHILLYWPSPWQNNLSKNAYPSNAQHITFTFSQCASHWPAADARSHNDTIRLWMFRSFGCLRNRVELATMAIGMRTADNSSTDQQQGVAFSEPIVALLETVGYYPL